MQGFLIKYTDECPHTDLRNTYLRRNAHRNVHEFSIFDSLDSAQRTLRRLRWRKYAVVIEVDLKPVTMFVPTDDWFAMKDETASKNNKIYRKKKERGQLERYGAYEAYRKVRPYRPEDLNAKPDQQEE